MKAWTSEGPVAVREVPSLCVYHALCMRDFSVFVAAPGVGARNGKRSTRHHYVKTQYRGPLSRKCPVRYKYTGNGMGLAPGIGAPFFPFTVDDQLWLCFLAVELPSVD